MTKEDRNNEMDHKSRINIYMIMYMFIWVMILLFLLWKARFGAASYDESLYLTIPYRLQQGDAMLWDEWNLAQLSVLATIPFVSFYRLLFWGTEGITLAYRYYSVVVWSFLSLALYIRLRRYLLSRKYPQWWAMVSSLLLMVYAPFGMMVLSYNTYALVSLILAGLILLPVKEDEIPGHRSFAAAGFVYAYSVLCCPHILLLWGAGFVYALTKRRIRFFADFTVGAGVLAVLSFLYILSKASPYQILKAIPVMLLDPYHQQVSVWGYIKDYILQVLFGIPNGIWFYLCFAILFAVIIVDRKREKRKDIYFAAGCFLTIILLILAWIFRRYINCFVYPLNILAAVCMFLRGKEDIKPVFLCFWMPGMIYSFCINMASNQYWLAISSASMVSLVGSILIIGMFVAGLIREKKRMGLLGAGGYVFSLVILFAMITALRYSFVFMDSNVSLQTEYIPEGPQKGIMASVRDKTVYDSIINDLTVLDDHKADRILFFSRDNWPYMLYSWRCAAYSPWLQNEIDDYTVTMLTRYYSMEESRKPDIIYIDSKYSKYADMLLAGTDYEIVETMPSGNAIAVPKGSGL